MCWSALELAQIMLLFNSQSERFLRQAEGVPSDLQAVDPAAYNNTRTIPPGTELDLLELSLASLDLYKTLMQTGVMTDGAQASANSSIQSNLSSSHGRNTSGSSSSSSSGHTPAGPSLVEPASLLAPDYAQCCIAICAVTGLDAVTFLPHYLMAHFQDHQESISSQRPKTGGIACD
jgi:hypothetical protein